MSEEKLVQSSESKEKLVYIQPGVSGGKYLIHSMGNNHRFPVL